MPLDLRTLPAAVRRAIGPRRAVRVRLGESGAAVHRLTAPGLATLYLKAKPLASERGAPPSVVSRERDRLLWIGRRLPVPEVVAYASTGRTEWLVTTAVAGLPASDRRHRDRGRLARCVGDALRRVHALPVADCPFDAGIEAYLELVRGHVRRGAIPGAEFVREHGASPAQVLAGLERARPAPVAPVFVHGDAYLPNLLLERGGLGGIVDWGDAGTGDPCYDLAFAIESLERNHGPGLERELLSGYGGPAPDAARIAWWRRADALF